ncbi:MAG: hypothetical protein LH472_06435, partial [Pyrinomonadaceae bacterium]|nr:hypothetical protein [Pyrinomonadaceae bacterium]
MPNRAVCFFKSKPAAVFLAVIFTPDHGYFSVSINYFSKKLKKCVRFHLILSLLSKRSKKFTDD